MDLRSGGEMSTDLDCNWGEEGGQQAETRDVGRSRRTVWVELEERPCLGVDEVGCSTYCLRLRLRTCQTGVVASESGAASTGDHSHQCVLSSRQTGGEAVAWLWPGGVRTAASNAASSTSLSNDRRPRNVVPEVPECAPTGPCHGPPDVT